MKSILIKDFKGMNLKEGLWDQSYSYYTRGMDFFGLGDNPSLVSIPGVLQKGLSFTSMSVSASLTSIVSDFARYSNFMYAMDSVNPSNIYRQSSASNWNLVSAITVSGIGSNLAIYNGNMYYSSNQYLGVYDNANGNANFQTLSLDYPHPMKVFAGSLFIANSRGIDKYDGTTYSASKLTLPVGFSVRSIEVFRDYLYVSADNNQYTRVFIWDGTSPTYNDSFTLADESFAPSLIATASYLWIVGNRGFSGTISTLTPIWAFQYGTPELVMRLPLRRNRSPGLQAPMSGLTVYQDGILVASSEGNGNSPFYGEGVGGVWYIGKDLTAGTYYAALLFPFNNGIPYQVNVGAIFTGGTNTAGTIPVIYGGLDNTTSSHSYEIHQTAVGVNSGNAWYSLPLDAGTTNDKSWPYMKVNFEALATGQRVVIYAGYTGNMAGNFSITTVKTFTATDPATDRNQFIRLGRTSRNITIAVVVDNTQSNVESTRLHSIEVFYEPTGN